MWLIELTLSSNAFKQPRDLEVDGCEASLLEAKAALGVVTSRFFSARPPYIGRGIRRPDISERS